ncbi:MAG: hypothetical protein MUF48_07625 [Pirellulaceae bacterium]|jgi:hypothetical protein|nr:hypothetical protein [Pirellulaceae bacterium]
MESNTPVAVTADLQPGSSTSVLRLPTFVCVFLCLVAGGILIGLVNAMFPIVDVPAELLVRFPPPEIAVAREASIKQTNMVNAMAALGILGLLMSGFLGLGEAAARGFGGGTMRRLVPGMVLATGVGCLSGIVGQLLVQQLHSPDGDMAPVIMTFLVQAGMLGLFGIGLGAALGFVAQGVSGVGTVMVSGLLAGLLAAFFFPVVSTFAAPDLHTEVVMPGGVLRGQRHIVGLVLYIGLIVIAWGLIIPLGNRRRGAKQVGSAG